MEIELVDLEDVPGRKRGPGRRPSRWAPFIEAARANPGKAVVAGVFESNEQAQARSNGLRKVAGEGFAVMVRENKVFLALEEE